MNTIVLLMDIHVSHIWAGNVHMKASVDELARNKLMIFILRNHKTHKCYLWLKAYKLSNLHLSDSSTPLWSELEKSRALQYQTDTNDFLEGYRQSGPICNSFTPFCMASFLGMYCSTVWRENFAP